MKPAMISSRMPAIAPESRRWDYYTYGSLVVVLLKIQDVNNYRACMNVCVFETCTDTTMLYIHLLLLVIALLKKLDPNNACMVDACELLSYLI